MGQPLTRRGPSGECLRCLMGFAFSPEAESRGAEDARKARTSDALRYGHFETAIGADGHSVELGAGAMAVTYRARDIDGSAGEPGGAARVVLRLRLKPALYPSWQEYFRKHQPPMLIVWGKNDFIFQPEGADRYKRDLKNVEFHLLDTGHFALEEEGPTIATLMRSFLAKQKL